MPSAVSRVAAAAAIAAAACPLFPGQEEDGSPLVLMASGAQPGLKELAAAASAAASAVAFAAAAAAAAGLGDPRSLPTPLAGHPL